MSFRPFTIPKLAPETHKARCCLIAAMALLVNIVLLDFRGALMFSPMVSALYLIAIYSCGGQPLLRASTKRVLLVNLVVVCISAPVFHYFCCWVMVPKSDVLHTLCLAWSSTLTVLFVWILHQVTGFQSDTLRKVCLAWPSTLSALFVWVLRRLSGVAIRIPLVAAWQWLRVMLVTSFYTVCRKLWDFASMAAEALRHSITYVVDFITSAEHVGRWNARYLTWNGPANWITNTGVFPNIRDLIRICGPRQTRFRRSNGPIGFFDAEVVTDHDKGNGSDHEDGYYSRPTEATGGDHGAGTDADSNQGTVSDNNETNAASHNGGIITSHDENTVASENNDITARHDKDPGANRDKDVGASNDQGTAAGRADNTGAAQDKCSNAGHDESSVTHYDERIDASSDQSDAVSHDESTDIVHEEESAASPKDIVDFAREHAVFFGQGS